MELSILIFLGFLVGTLGISINEFWSSEIHNGVNHRAPLLQTLRFRDVMGCRNRDQGATEGKNRGSMYPPRHQLTIANRRYLLTHPGNSAILST
jgi:hypothetical protein